MWLNLVKTMTGKDVTLFQSQAPQYVFDPVEDNTCCDFCEKPLAYARQMVLIQCDHEAYMVHPACREDFLAKEIYARKG